MTDNNNMDNNNCELNNFESLQIGLASTEKILSWSHGEVTKPETINYRTLKPERDGLFCERIFGPSKDWECHCGKYKKIKDKGIVCDKCGVEVTKSSVRRDRMGHIHLAAPVSHIWYFKGIPSRMDLILDIGPKNLEKVLYFAAYIVLDPGTTDIPFKKILTEQEYRELYDQYGNAFRVGMGAEAILELLKNVNLEEEAAKLKEELANTTSQKAARLIKRIEVIEAFINAGTKPEWMILTEVPVIPPDLRPMVQLDGGRFATSDLNDLYRRIINRNNRLARLMELGAPEIIVRNEKRMLQEAVDALIDNGRRNGRPVTGPGNRALKSLSDLLKGKQGRFRQNLLGKRVDYSGRSVIVVGPELKIYQCGLPMEMAIELFKPFVMRELVRRGLAENIKKAKKSVEHLENDVWDVLEDVIKEHPVMLNRAPTLHRLGIQAFEPILVEGKAIKLHPLVCTAFNADFDGDQMAVHLPLSVEAQAECRFMLLSPNNLLKPSDGGPVAVPSQDMVLGIYYLTQERPGAKGEGKRFKDISEAILAYENGVITLHSKIMVHVTKEINGQTVSGNVESTLGRFIFNEILPQDLGFVDRSKPENALVPEVDFHVGKKQLKDILQHVINTHGTTTTAEVLDDIKATGYKYSTRAAMTVSISEMTVPPIKKELIANAEKKVEQITQNYYRGRSTDEERHKNVIKVWQETDERLKDALLAGLDKYNNIFMMADSGARGSNQQIKQLAGMRGLMADTSGNTIELPIKSNFREGLDVLEYFISAHGARKGLSDTALRTADSGYLTRRLVDVSQDLVIRENDCSEGKSIPGMYVYEFVNEKATADSDAKADVLESLQERITGRFLAEDIVDPATGEVILAANHLVTPKRAEAIVKTGVERVKIRTILTCRSHIGVCAKCYGSNMATGQTVQVGEAVGIIAAQSIGEPGTQLTMRTFHTGGVASDSITQGLPRVEELFEARKPKTLAVLAEFGGVVSFARSEKKTDIVITDDEGNSKAYPVSRDTRVKVSEGQIVEKGEEITEGSENPHDIVRILGVRAVQDYMIREVQKVYRIQGVEINDKHIELIVRQMLKKIVIDSAGDSDFLPGSQVDTIEFTEVNERLEEEGKQPATGTPIILGITKASLATNSFMSAASFQETTKVLTDAAINGKVDPLIGLKENVIIGKLIPAGTGMKRYQNVQLDTGIVFDETEEEQEEEDTSAEESAENTDNIDDADDAEINITEESEEDVISVTEE
jgi:DNA-directed RNA polymerase subunit beta'